MLDTHLDLSDTNSVRQDSKGLTAVVHSPSSFPLTAHKSIPIQPGRETTVSIKAIDIKSTALRKAKPSQRKCHFPDDEEASLRLFLNYSQVLIKNVFLITLEIV